MQILLEKNNNKNYDILSKPKQQLNILFLGERLRDNNSFAKQILNSGKVTGTIVSKTHMSIDTALRLLETNLTRQFNVVVIMLGSKDVQEKTADAAKQKLEQLYKIAKSDGAKVIAISNPTKKFAYGYEQRFPSNDSLAMWIEKEQNAADYTITANSLTDNELFFEKDGITLNEQGQLVIAKQILIVLKDLGVDVESEDVDDTVVGDKAKKLKNRTKLGIKGSKILDALDIEKLQKRLIFLGYEIADASEITSKRIGAATKTAINDFQLLNGLTQSGEATPATLRVLYSGSAVSYNVLLYANAKLFGVPTNPEQVKDDAEKEEPREEYVPPSKNVSAFLKKIQPMAISQEKLHGIPASITMAQAALESGWGTSQLAAKYNNYFGVKCGSFSKCVELMASDGSPAKWRVYSSIDASFDDHSKVLKASRYSKAFSYPVSDYKNWAKAIEAGGYAGSETTYASTLISLIEKYNLDKISSGGGSGPNKKISSASDIANVTVGSQAIFQGAGGSLIGSTGGGMSGNWAGSLPKLISILPAGSWSAGSQKRSKVETASGGWSDHNLSKTFAYGADFGLNSTFNGDKIAATEFAIAVARNAGKDITSWEPYIGSVLNINTTDGYRVQIIWQSNVGGNHYDHVHVGVKSIDGEQQYYKGV